MQSVMRVRPLESLDTNQSQPVNNIVDKIWDNYGMNPSKPSYVTPKKSSALPEIKSFQTLEVSSTNQANRSASVQPLSKKHSKYQSIDNDNNFLDKNNSSKTGRLLEINAN